MKSKKAIILCASCGYKKVCEPEDTGLVELKNDTLSPRKFRCPGCGRAVAPRSFPDPQSELEGKAKEERLKAEHEAFVGEAMDFQRRFSEGADG